MKKRIFATLCALLCLLFTIVPAQAKTAPAASSVSLSAKTLSLVVGKSATLKATIKPTTANKNVKWKSSSPSVAQVKDGIVTGKKVGKATITVTAGKKTATCVVTVSAPKPTATPSKPTPAKPTATQKPTPAPKPTPTPVPAKMSVSSIGIVKDTIGDAYGMYGKQQSNGVPTRSLPLSIKDAPKGTLCYAITMMDPDSKPLCGYVWTHWLAANIITTEISENASIDLAKEMVQGKNDYGTNGYGGPTPPDKPHTYVITVYALDAKLDLKDGFSKAQLDKAMKDHVLASAAIRGTYRN